MRIKQILAPSLLAVIGGSLLIQLPLAIADRSATYEWFDPIIEIRRILLDRFVEEPDDEGMQQAMIRAMVDTIDDPYTSYVPPARIDDFNKELRGTYVGIGAEVNMSESYLQIVTPMDDSPAIEAGVRAGDLVLEIEGTSTFEVPIAECVTLLMGEPGTPVQIRVRHLDGTEEDLTVIRRQITTVTVKGVRRHGEAWSWCLDEAHGIAYARVTQFTGTSVSDLREALDDILATSPRGLVLDLRDNPGGSLTAAVQMADMFLDEGVIVSVKGRDSGEDRDFEARTGNTLTHTPMIVLINGGSASASEIVAGALQENTRAKVLGTRTFGKGSVQEVRELEYDRGTLKYTTARYYLPSGRSIQRVSGAIEWGVDPDPGMVVPVSDEDYIEKIRARREVEVIREADPGAPPCADPVWIRETLRDEQLARAVEILGTFLDEESWPAAGDLHANTVAIADDLRREAERRSWLIEQLARTDERMSALRGTADEVGVRDFIADEIDPTEGTIELRDRDGNVIGTWRIEGGNVELALMSLRLADVDE